MVTRREVNRTGVADDPYWTLAEWKKFIDSMIRKYGDETIMTTNAGYNNVELRIEEVKIVEVEDKKSVYCKPYNAGLASETKAVCSRLGRLIKALDTEINSMIVEGDITKEIQDFRYSMIERLRKDGWEIKYSGNDRLSVKSPK